MTLDFKTIPGESQTFGVLDDALEERLEVITEELFKKGTLSGDTINWTLVETASTDVLAKASHMLAFRGLILSLIEQATPESLSNALEAGTVLFSEHYPKLHPKGKKFQRKKTSWAEELVAALTAAVTNEQSVLDKSIVQTAGTAFCETAAKHDLNVAVLRRSLEEVEHLDEPQKTRGRPTASVAEVPHIETTSALDAKGRAQLRREIQSLAHKIFTNAPEAGISYEMRGYAGWMEFQVLPEAGPTGKTQVQKMPNSVLESHRRSLSTPSLNELQRLEERLISNPDWFEGHHLASKVAARLALPTAAEAIRHRVEARLRQWPELRDLKYSNDAPFVSEEVTGWIGRCNGNPETIQKTGSEGDSAQEGDLNALLASVDAEIAAAQSPRDKALAKLRLLREFKRLGHVSQAKMMAEELCDAISTTSAKDWDEHLLKLIEAELK